MALKVDENGNLIFSSGRFEAPNRGIVGIDPEGNIWHGYDDGLPGIEMTPEERHDLAIEMIIRWLRFMPEAK